MSRREEEGQQGDQKGIMIYHNNEKIKIIQNYDGQDNVWIL